jgi:mycothiol synthase
LTTATLEVRKIDTRSASPEEYAALSDFWNAIRKEREPEEAPLSQEERVANWRNRVSFHVEHAWVAFEGPRVVAVGLADYFDKEENRHLLGVNISVLPEWRRQGIARDLLSRILEVAQETGRHLLTIDTAASVPAGEAFMKRLGAEAGLETHLNILRVADLDGGLLESWIARASERASAYSIIFHDGPPYPEERLAEVANLFKVMNTAPRGDLDVEDEEFSAEQVREWEARTAATGTKRFTAWAALRETGELVGVNELFWKASRPDTVENGATGVRPEHRDRGLGRWLKAANLLRVLDQHPEVTKVRTGNADSNRPMLNINYTMGFRPAIAYRVWQVRADRVAEYLARN